MLNKIKGNIIMVGECVAMSLRNIVSNRMRSFLTVLGILIGVSAVIALITTVSSVSGSLSSSFSSLGAGTLSVSVTGSDLKSGMTTQDLAELTELDAVDGIVPGISLMTRVSYGGTYNRGISVSGKSAYYFRETADLLLRGRTLSFIDEENSLNVCWIDSDIIEKFFYGIDPIGESIYISGLPFLVAGIFDQDATNSVSGMLAGSADILIPYTTAMKMNSVNEVTSFTVYLAQGWDSDAASSMIENRMEEQFSYEEDCFTVTTMSGIEDTMEKMLSMMTMLLAGIASISLIVGGIGIMNMMLTSVTERITEIGLKKALGALPWQIQIQFLIESFLLSIIGGIAGIILGIILSFALCRVMDTSFSISVGAIILGVGFSAAVGIVFGWAPAHKASRLNPIDALRSL